MSPKTILDILRENNRLTNENSALKKKLNDTKTDKIAKDVAVHVNNWLDEPYWNKSMQEDIEEFALKITRYVDHRLKE